MDESDEEYKYFKTGYDIVIRSDGYLFVRQGHAIEELLEYRKAGLRECRSEFSLNSEVPLSHVNELKGLSGVSFKLVPEVPEVPAFSRDVAVFNAFPCNEQTMVSQWHVCPVLDCKRISNKSATAVARHIAKAGGAEGINFLMRWITHQGSDDPTVDEPELDAEHPEYPLDHWKLLKPMLLLVTKYCVRNLLRPSKNESAINDFKQFILIQACKLVAPPTNPQDVHHWFIIRGIINFNGFHHFLKNEWDVFSPKNLNGTTKRKTVKDVDAFLLDLMLRERFPMTLDSRDYCRGLFLSHYKVEPPSADMPKSFIKPRRKRSSKTQVIELSDSDDECLVRGSSAVTTSTTARFGVAINVGQQRRGLVKKCVGRESADDSDVAESSEGKQVVQSEDEVCTEVSPQPLEEMKEDDRAFCLGNDESEPEDEQDLFDRTNSPVHSRLGLSIPDTDDSCENDSIDEVIPGPASQWKQPPLLSRFSNTVLSTVSNLMGGQSPAKSQQAARSFQTAADYKRQKFN